MAAPISTEENREERRLAMVNYRRAGKSYDWIGMKMKVSRQTARTVVLRACNRKDPKNGSE
jgi:transposase